MLLMSWRKNWIHLASKLDLYEIHLIKITNRVKKLTDIEKKPDDTFDEWRGNPKG